MKKTILSLFALLAIAAPASAAMMWTSTDIKPRVTLKYTDPTSGKPVMRNFSSSDATFLEMHRDMSNRHYIYVRAENRSGMAITVSGLGMGVTKVKGSTDAVLVQQANIAAPEIDFGNGMVLTPDSLKMKGTYTAGVTGLASGSITITATGMLNFFGMDIPALVTLTPAFRSLPVQDSFYADDRFNNTFTPDPHSALPPTAEDQSFSVAFGKDQAVDFLAGAVSFQEPGDLDVVISDGPSNGSLTPVLGGKATYQPAANFGGVDIIHFIVKDIIGNPAAVHTITLAVSARPQAEEIVQSLERDSTATAIDFSSLALGSGVSVSAVNLIPGVTTGALAGTAPNFTYRPAAGFAGLDRFTYTISGTGTTFTDTGNVTMQVTPVAMDDFITFDRALGLAQVFDVLANDFGLDGTNAGLTVTETSAAKHGALTNNGTNITYTADNAAGVTEDSFTYTVKDSSNKTGTGIVRIFYKP